MKDAKTVRAAVSKFRSAGSFIIQCSLPSASGLALTCHTYARTLALRQHDDDVGRLESCTAAAERKTFLRNSNDFLPNARLASDKPCLWTGGKKATET